MIDFRRNKDGIVAKVERIEYDPTAPPSRWSATQTASVVTSSPSRPRCWRAGGFRRRGTDQGRQRAPIRNIPVGSTLHCVELSAGKGAQLARAAGTSVQLLAREGSYAQLRLRSGEIRRVHVECRATIGEVGNSEHSFARSARRARTAGAVFVRPSVVLR